MITSVSYNMKSIQHRYAALHNALLKEQSREECVLNKEILANEACAQVSTKQAVTVVGSGAGCRLLGKKRFEYKNSEGLVKLMAYHHPNRFHKADYS